MLVEGLPAVSLAIAVSVCVPLANAVVFQEYVYGDGAAFQFATGDPSANSRTDDNPILELAATWMATVPETVTLLPGALKETVGGG